MAVYFHYYIWLGLSSETILVQEDKKKSKQVVSPIWKLLTGITAYW